MSRSLTVGLVVWMCLTPPSAAQAPAVQRSRLTLVVGPLLVAARDRHASPLRYQGTGPFLQVGYANRTERRVFTASIGGSVGMLRSATTGADDLPRQELKRGWIDLEYARPLGAPGPQTRWLLGGRLTERGTVLRHLTVAAGGTVIGYALYSAAVGPFGAIEHAVGPHGAITAQLAVPVFAVIGRPYGGLYRDLTLIPGGLHFRLATVNAFQAADFSAAYAVQVGSGAELTVAYRLVVERYLDAEPFAFAAQGASIGVALPLEPDR